MTRMSTKFQLEVVAPSNVLGACAALIAAVLMPVSASAVVCYVAERPDGHVSLHEKPTADSKVLARMPPSSMVSPSPRVREREGWIHVRWWKSQPQPPASGQRTGHVDARGWMNREFISGECDD